MNFLFMGLVGFNFFTVSQKVYYDLYPFLIVIVPAMYLYFVNINIDQSTQILSYKQLKHFIFPIGLVILNLVVKHFFAFTFTPFWIKNFFSILFIAYLIYYTTRSYFSLKDTLYNKETDIVNIKQNKVLKEWTTFIFTLFTLIIFQLIIIIIINLTSDNNYVLNNYKYIPAFLLDVMYFKILFTPEILYGHTVMYKKIKEYNNSNFILKDIWDLNPSEKITNIQDQALSIKIAEYTSNYVQDIEKLVFNHEILRNPTVSITDIANNLKIPKSHLIFVFKYLSKVSFTEFKKIVRTYDAIQLIEEDYLKSNTIESLATKVGFSSYSPFYITFKDITGLCPQNYTNNQTSIIKA